MYLDPGGLSLLAQLLIGSVVAIPMLIGVYWKQVRAFVLMLRLRIKNGKNK